MATTANVPHLAPGQPYNLAALADKGAAVPVVTTKYVGFTRDVGRLMSSVVLAFLCLA